MKITAKVTGKRQITIPLKICELCKIKNGDNVVFTQKNDEILFSKEVNLTICPICDGKGSLKNNEIEETECFFCKGKKEIEIKSNNPMDLIIKAMNNSRKYKIGISCISQRKNEDNSITILDKPIIKVYSSDFSQDILKEIENRLQKLINKGDI